ncbi:MAG: DUF3054 domain-containing protein [Acidimicrobiales bacterium]
MAHDTTPSSPAPTRTVVLALALDLASILAFVTIGRRSHQETDAIRDILRTAAPFLMAVVPAWVVSRVWVNPTSLRTGGTILVVTIVAGMYTRRVLFDEGIASTFIVVATLFLTACLLGWRLIARFVAHRRPHVAPVG